VAPYERALQARPITTKAATGASLGFAGDLAAQRLPVPQQRHHRADDTTKVQAPAARDIDWGRLSGFTAFGALYVGLFNHHWFGWLSRRIPVRNRGQRAQKARLCPCWHLTCQLCGACAMHAVAAAGQ
jgi:hypothetical protein